MITGLAAGVGPAIRGTRVSLAEAMKAQSRSVGMGLRGALVGKALVSAQIAFCLLLLVLAALFTRSMQSLLQIEVGYDRAALLVARMDVRSVGYSSAERQALYGRVAGAGRPDPRRHLGQPVDERPDGDVAAHELHCRSRATPPPVTSSS